MSFFKKLTKGSSDKKDEQKEAKRKQTLVSELQKSSGLSVAFMTELKQKTEAIRLLKLENDEWSDDEDVTPNVGVDSASNYPLSSPVVPKDSKGKLDLKAVAARMGLKKRPKKEDKKNFWNQAGSKSSLRKKLHERYLEAPDQQNQLIKDAANLAHHKAANRLTILEQRRALAVQKSSPVPRSAPGTLRRRISAEELSSEDSTSTSPSVSRSGSIDKASTMIPVSAVPDRGSSSPLKRNRSGTTMVIVNAKPAGEGGPSRSPSEKDIKPVVKTNTDGKPPLVVSTPQEIPTSRPPSHAPPPVPPPSAAATNAVSDLKQAETSLGSEDKSPRDETSPRDGEEKPKKKSKKPKKTTTDGSSEASTTGETPKKKKKHRASAGEMEKSKSDLALSVAAASAPSLLPSASFDVSLLAPPLTEQGGPQSRDEIEQRSHSMPGIVEDRGALEASLQPSGDASLDLLRLAAAKLQNPGAAKGPSALTARPTGGRAASSANSTLRREIDVAAGKTVELTRRLGKGSFGTVWAGVLNGRQIALKQISLMEMSKDKKAQIRAQIKKELELVKPLRHENVLRYYGMFFSKEAQEVSLVMELVDGVTLSDLIAFQTKLPEKLAAFILRQLVDSLEYLHGNFIIHRDLKPDNILVDASGKIKVIDFGCSAAADPDETMKRRSTVGTPWYCSPEVVNCDEYDFRADIWSVGCSTIELVSGKPPYDDLNDIACLFKMAEGNSPPIPDGISPECADFLTQTLRPDPKTRPTAADLLQHPFLSLSETEMSMTLADIRTLVTEMNNQRRKLAEEDDE